MKVTPRLGIGPQLYKSFHDGVNLIAESDRAVVLIIANDIENALEAVFLKVFDDRLNKQLTKDLFDFSGPLGTYSAKFKMAYAFGFIDKVLYDDLDRLRKMRNDVAHSSSEFSFDDNDTEQKLLTFGPFKELHTQWRATTLATQLSGETVSDFVARTVSVNKICVLQMLGLFKKLVDEKAASVKPATDLLPGSPQAFVLGV